jgi:hypothetical protein
VYAQFTRACQWSDEDWVGIERRIKDKLVANAEWGLTRFPLEFRRQNDIALVNRILDATTGLNHS